ncbi:cytochrome P450 [Massilia sp. ST3]|uniref:cytochrome P450 n=1 Tax=Massilia sp. ST3 TaxID=2824903 RepID=UPI001B8139C2|nr:cytochrome P450 [Massilia sp. ST3]MBQ5947534.1 cytochrome P450 [Massilia sp. ST3]
MTTPTSSRCPFHADGMPPAPDFHPPGMWPPGPRAGITGWSLLARMARDMPAALADWRGAHGDVVHLRIWPEHQVIVSDPQLVRELLVNQHDAHVRWERGIQIFSQVHGRSVLIEEGERWQAKRQALQPAFAPKPVKAFAPVIAAACAQALARWPAGAAAMPVESALTALAMDVIMRMMFSSEIGDDARLAERALHLLSADANDEMFWPASWPDWMPWKREQRRMKRALKALVERHVAARLSMPYGTWPDDLLTRLLDLHRADSAAWPLGAVRDECMTAFLAGHETTAATLTWWAWCMASHPEAQEAARREVAAVLDGRAPTAEDLPALGYLGRSLQETLRLYPAAPILMSRRALKPIRLGGWTLPARTILTVPLGLMQRDARWFPEPERFRPDRFLEHGAGAPRGAFMPFGAGPRVCLGQHLALAEMTVIAAMILQRFRLSVPQGMPAPQPQLNVTLRPATPLHLVLEDIAPAA